MVGQVFGWVDEPIKKVKHSSAKAAGQVEEEGGGLLQAKSVCRPCFLEFCHEDVSGPNI